MRFRFSISGREKTSAVFVGKTYRDPADNTKHVSYLDHVFVGDDAEMVRIVRYLHRVHGLTLAPEDFEEAA